MSNNITITGRIAQDPELRFAQSGKAMCNLSIPDQERKKNDRGEWEDASATTWFRVTLFDDAAEAFAEVGKKGDEVIATGRLVTREWEGKEGDTRSSLELRFAKVAIVPKAKGSGAQRQSADAAWGAPAQQAPQGGGWGQQAQGGAGYEPAPF